jgi:hypothetical protein
MACPLPTDDTWAMASRRRHTETARLAVTQEACVHSVSTGRVDDRVRAQGAASFSTSAESRVYAAPHGWRQKAREEPRRGARAGVSPLLQVHAQHPPCRESQRPRCPWRPVCE